MLKCLDLKTLDFKKGVRPRILCHHSFPEDQSSLGVAQISHAAAVSLNALLCLVRQQQRAAYGGLVLPRYPGAVRQLQLGRRRVQALHATHPLLSSWRQAASQASK